MLDQIANVVENNLPAASAAAVVVLDLLFRLIKSDKPLSIAHAIAGIAHKLANIMDGIAKFLDKVLPQKLK